MKHIKTIETMVADVKKKAHKQGGKAEIIKNGRMSYDYGEKGPLREMYAMTIDGNTFTMRHWGTQTLKVDMSTSTLLSYYGESNSDRDSMDTALYTLGLDERFRYRPSLDLFEIKS